MTGLTLSEIGTLLKSFSLPEGLTEQVLSCIELSEMGSYSPEKDNISSKEYIQTIDDLITKIDKEL